MLHHHNSSHIHSTAPTAGSWTEGPRNPFPSSAPTVVRRHNCPWRNAATQPHRQQGNNTSVNPFEKNWVQVFGFLIHADLMKTRLKASSFHSFYFHLLACQSFFFFKFLILCMCIFMYLLPPLFVLRIILHFFTGNSSNKTHPNRLKEAFGSEIYVAHYSLPLCEIIPPCNKDINTCSDLRYCWDASCM